MTECEQLERAIAHMEAQRAILGDAAVEAALAPMREKLAVLAKAETPTPKLRGERKLVTVMFADISGFTALAETMDPEAVRDLINACFDHLVPAIEKYEGTVDKFVGDAIVALFGAPVAHENDPERALRAALEIMEALKVFNARHDTDGSAEASTVSSAEPLAEVL
ncbi:MAG: adenylate/guanylate cyclase domain-containing protein, partial [Anaerolineales bacterium]|nr:adenylate/guanylate cyclase domain-containing protein [Anaerolineales bacterium]